MRNIKVVAVCLSLALAGILFSGCGDDAEAEKKRIADSLNQVNNQLAGELNEKEMTLQEFIASFNEIQENLNAIKEKEKIVSTVNTKADVRNRHQQIREDIQAIYDLMEKNKNRINTLTAKLKNSNLKLSGMEKMIENLQMSLNLKDEEIEELKIRIEGLNVELSNMGTNYRAAEKENAAKTEALNTAYFAIGTSKELKEKQVIAKEGGFIGLGKATKVAADFNKEYFTKINIQQTKTINIGAKKMNIITTHPKTSYTIVGEKPVEKIEISNPEEFWSSSKYLVIMIE
jgi:hypothetical protein